MTEYLFAGSLWWDGRLHPGAALRVEEDGLAGPVPGDDVPAGAPRRRFPGTLLPGLVDAHVHSALVDLATVRAGGIAAVWDLGADPAAVAALAARSATARPRLPRIRYAGPFLIAPGGYPSDRAWAPAGSCWAIDSATAAIEAVGRARDGGATLIKVTAHAGGPLLPAATMAALVEAAHAAEMPVVVHAQGPGTVAAALEAGADLLAHTPWTEPLDDGLIRDCAARMQWISTLDIHGYGTETPDLVTAVGNLRRFLSYGGSVRYGTDLGNGPLPPAINPREIRHLQSAGLTPAATLTAMTGSATWDVSWVPGGLDLEPGTFADSLATARVLTPDVRPRQP
jgi:imidazolonepropionase-like amidohydrolase